MKYNYLGKSGLRVSELSFGSWITFGTNLDLSGAKDCIKKAFELGVNFFDNAEVYAKGESEILMGKALAKFRREDLVISTKIFWGGNGPNDNGLSRKHLIEGTRNSLKRLGLDYVDILFCHRPDPNTPLEETIRAMDYLIKSGQTLYWGTSEWPAEKIEQAFSIAKELNLIPPTAEQPQYNLFYYRRVESDYAEIFKNHGFGITAWSPLNSGILSGKYNDGIPKNSRLESHQWLQKELSDERLRAVKQLQDIANNLGCTLAQLAIAWCLTNANVSTVITGASSPQQIEENMKAASVKKKLTEEILQKISTITRPS